MKKILKTTILFFLPFFLTGCFEIREEVNLADDGSGDVKLIVNLNESKERVKKYLQVEQGEDYSLPKDKNVEAIFNHIKTVLDGVKGLSNVAIKSDYEDLVFSIGADFANIDALNEAVTKVTSQLDYLAVPTLNARNFEYAANQFNRMFDYPIDTEEYESLPGFAKMALESARTISIYRFSQPIKSFSNQKATLSPSGKSIKLETSVADIGRGTGTLENKIEF